MKTEQIATAIILLAMLSYASAATYYLDVVNGNDSNPGTSSQPWKTIDKAKLTVIGGDTVKLRTGNYGAYSDPWGSAANHTDWITYEADSGQKPVLTGISQAGPDDVNSYLLFRGITVDVVDNPGGVRPIYLRNVNYFQFYDMNIIGAGHIGNDGSVGIFMHAVDNVVINNCAIYGDSNGIPDCHDIYGNPCAPDDYVSMGGISGKDFGKGFDCGILGEFGTGDTNITITNCNIWGHNTGIAISGSGWDVSNNDIHHCFDGIILIWVNTVASGLTDPVIISNNHIHTLIEYGATIKDPYAGYHADGIQFYDAEVNHVIIRGNRIHYMDADAMFLKGDRDGVENTDWLLENNLVYDTLRADPNPDTTGYSVVLKNCADATFRDNTIVGKGRFLAEKEGNSPTPMTFTVFANNIIRRPNLGTDLGSQGTIVKYENNNIINTVDNWGMTQFVWGPNTVILNSDLQYKALFNNFDANDFSLAAGSIAINAADPQYAPATDILGNPRVGAPDIGAYEFQGTAPQECIDNNKLMDYIFQWKQGSITMTTLMQKIGAWKAGTGC